MVYIYAVQTNFFFFNCLMLLNLFLVTREQLTAVKVLFLMAIAEFLIVYIYIQFKYITKFLLMSVVYHYTFFFFFF
jgi:hypothetical protein